MDGLSQAIAVLTDADGALLESMRELARAQRHLTPTDLAQISELSCQTIWRDIHGGYLHCTVLTRGLRKFYRVDPTEGARWLKSIGLERQATLLSLAFCPLDSDTRPPHTGR